MGKTPTSIRLCKNRRHFNDYKMWLDSNGSGKALVVLTDGLRNCGIGENTLRMKRGRRGGRQESPVTSSSLTEEVTWLELELCG